MKIIQILQWASFLGLATLLAGCSGEETAQQETTEPEAVEQPQASPPDKTDRGVFTNPLLPNGADPWLEYWDGNYYLTTTTWTSELVMRKSPTLSGLSTATPINIWSDTDPLRHANFWAFEFHRLNGPNGYRWYVMYTAGQDGTLDHQHLNVLESVGDDPLGPYQYKAPIMPDQWNIDGTYLEHNGKRYLLYSQWHGDEQRNLITEMDTPWSVREDSPRVVLTRPEHPWETSGRKVTEAAQILQRGERTFMIYSASYCNTPDYKLGMMELVGDDPMQADSWEKFPEPVFQRGNGVYGPGHNGFFQSPDGSQDWLVYHGNSSVEHGCSATRSLRAQQFTWNDDGTPNFGEPLAEGELVDPPSGENGPLITRVQGQHYQLVNSTSELCLGIASNPNQNHAVQAECNVNNGQWVADPTGDGYFRLANVHDSKFLEVADCSSANNARIQQAAWRNNPCQEWQFQRGEDGWLTVSNRETGKPLGVAGCAATANQAVLQQDRDSFCKQWRLQPMGDVALMSEQSGRAVGVDACAADAGANVQQDRWEYRDCQKWRFEATDSGFYQLRPAHRDNRCLAVAEDTIVPGGNLVQAECGTTTGQWRLEMLEGGAVSLANRYTNQVMNLAHCGLADGTNLAQAPAQGTKCQRFHLRATE